jgi:hypothetical protein
MVSVAPPFLVGANLPWIRYGCDFGANAWQPEGGLAAPGRREDARRELSALAGCGATTVRWFLLCDGRSGLAFDAESQIGPDARLYADIDAGLRLLQEAGLSVMFVLTDFKWFSWRRMCRGVQLGGRSHLLVDPGCRSRVMSNVVAPLLERYGREPVIWAWEIINEPDWVTTRWPWVRRRAMSGAGLRAFVAEATALVHSLTRHAATVGSARPSTLARLQGLGLDFYQVHWYDKLRCRFALDAPAASLGTDAPVMLAEFPTCGSRRPPASILEAARAQGYAGAFPWSACATDTYSSRATLYTVVHDSLQNGAVSISMRDWAQLFRPPNRSEERACLNTRSTST